MAPQYKLSDSESESDNSLARLLSDEALEKGLRDEVARIYASGNMENLTVKRVRLAAEKKLGLTEGFFKTTDDWKTRSDQIIKEEVENQDNGSKEKESQPVEKSPSPPPSPQKAAKRAKAENAPKPRKRQKTQTPISKNSEDEVSDKIDDESEEEVAKPQKRKVPMKKDTKPKPRKEESPEASDVPDENPDTAKPTVEAAIDDSESEMSVVLDEEPKPARKRSKSTDTAGKKEKKKGMPKPKGKELEVDPDQEEIKRLQGWLVKCGIRKMWWRELQPYETPKAKIKHLKQMLEDAGMKGRYSLEKAKAIRDERELKADLEMIQQGAKQWGTGGEQGSDEPPPRRAAARGRQALAFLEDEDEESD
ncbi:uncharacterized protein N7477_006724 [Penicillium maclennaniae]|uniref:uncharacterized protein n=1 Tax=Penicillium maclennaniae TaxID=1343394 RepID=UPI00253F85B6|nr:uncharacterized protein N7477_006724 [Penicillium maclennaniae]KAJ5668154.1 hypothetical protein N7477_006724 [Penicillium maclennaniae]